MTRSALTAVKMLESLPEETQERVVEKLCELVEEFRDERMWMELFGKRKKNLAKVMREVREDIASGKATEMDYDKL